MNRESLYHKTVDILVQAYFNDTLQHSSCNACAVGNIILRSNDTEPVKSYGDLKWPHDKFPYHDTASWFDVVRKNKIPDDYINSLISKTGYSWEELRLIEHSFESVNSCKSKDEYMFNGLMAVVSILDKIHENNDTNISETSKQKFQKVLAQ